MNKKQWKIAIGISSAIVLFFAVLAYSYGAFNPNSQAQSDLRIKGNKNSKIYHLAHCQNYDDIASRNIRWFKSHDEARNAGYRMAENCNR